MVQTEVNFLFSTCCLVSKELNLSKLDNCIKIKCEFTLALFCMCQSNALDGIWVNGNIFIKLFAENSLGSAGDFPDFKLKPQNNSVKAFEV